MDLNTLISELLPEGSVLYKESHGYYVFYKNGNDFMCDHTTTRQNYQEPLQSFVERTIVFLLENQDSFQKTA